MHEIALILFLFAMIYGGLVRAHWEQEERRFMRSFNAVLDAYKGVSIAHQARMAVLQAIYSVASRDRSFMVGFFQKQTLAELKEDMRLAGIPERYISNG